MSTLSVTNVKNESSTSNNLVLDSSANTTVGGNLIAQAGSAATPSIQATGDTNTGIYFSAADTVDIATGGTQRVQFDSSGNLRFNSGYGSVATAYGVRAWCYGDLVGTITIHESGGVTSLTDSATGQFIVNFSFTFPDVNYAVTGTATDGTGEANFLSVRTAGTNPVRSTTAISMEIYTYLGGRIDAEFGLAVLR